MKLHGQACSIILEARGVKPRTARTGWCVGREVLKLNLATLKVEEIRTLLFGQKKEAKESLVNLMLEDKRAEVRKLAQAYQRNFSKREGERKRLFDLSCYEQSLRKEGFELIAGVDESGRGALAGPLVAGAVVLPANVFIPGLKECKQVLPKKREELFEQIVRQAVSFSAVLVEPQQIDQIGLQQANLLALRKAIEKLNPAPQFVLADGFFIPELKVPHLHLINGDVLSLSIAAASIISKVTRDRIMQHYHKKHPSYGFEKHKGYGTALHLKVIRKQGPCQIHRRTYRPVKDSL